MLYFYSTELILHLIGNHPINLIDEDDEILITLTSRAKEINFDETTAFCCYGSIIDEFCGISANMYPKLEFKCTNGGGGDAGDAKNYIFALKLLSWRIQESGGLYTSCAAAYYVPRRGWATVVLNRQPIIKLPFIEPAKCNKVGKLIDLCNIQLIKQYKL